MKYIDPTDDELNAAVAEHVAKSVPCCAWSSFIAGAGSMIKDGTCNHDNCFPVKCPVNYCKYADAVLPWLEKQYIETELKSWWDSPAQHFNESTRQGHRVFDPKGIWSIRVPGKNAMAEDKSFARAAVIALLRANGHEVEFTK